MLSAHQPILESFDFLADDDVPDVSDLMEAEDVDDMEETVVLAPVDDVDVDYDPELGEIYPLFV